MTKNGNGAPAAPISAPLRVVADSFSRSEGTPAHSAAISSSLSAANPRPNQDRSTARAISTEMIAMISMTIRDSG